MIHLFAGWDEREAVGFHVFVQSVMKRASQPVSIVPLSSMGLPQGSNAFTLSRFLVPELMAYRGHAIFCDGSDMLMRADIAELDALFDPRYAVQLVKHAPYKTKHKIKYKGTSMECPNTNYERKNWTSVMLINCEHEAWGREGPASVLQALQLRTLADSEIGELPSAWNVLADEDQPIDGAKVLHWTAGVPAFAAYAQSPGAKHWHRERADMERI